MSDKHCPCPEEVTVPITGITVPFCGFGVNIDASKLPKCECGLTREDVQAMIEASRYTLCEFYYFRNPALRPGFEKAEGGIIENAATLYPEAWAYLQTEEGRALCATEEDWQAMNHAVWHTNADGTEIGWDGIGGAPFFVPNLETGSLRLPDVRGMYAEAAGFDELEVGGVHGDGIRNITGETRGTISQWNAHAGTHINGAIRHVMTPGNARGNLSGGGVGDIYIDVSNAVPTANKNAPRAFGALPCIYLGVPK